MQWQKFTDQESEKFVTRQRPLLGSAFLTLCLRSPDAADSYDGRETGVVISFSSISLTSSFQERDCMFQERGRAYYQSDWATQGWLWSGKIQIMKVDLNRIAAAVSRRLNCLIAVSRSHRHLTQSLPSHAEFKNITISDRSVANKKKKSYC